MFCRNVVHIFNITYLVGFWKALLSLTKSGLFISSFSTFLRRFQESGNSFSLYFSRKASNSLSSSLCFLSVFLIGDELDLLLLDLRRSPRSLSRSDRRSRSLFRSREREPETKAFQLLWQNLKKIISLYLAGTNSGIRNLDFGFWKLH